MISAADPVREGQKRWDKKHQQLMNLIGIVSAVSKEASGYSYLEEGMKELEIEGDNNDSIDGQTETGTEES